MKSALAALAVWVALIGSCDESQGPEPIDATKVSSVKIDAAVDAGAVDAGPMDALDAPVDGMRNR